MRSFRINSFFLFIIFAVFLFKPGLAQQEIGKYAVAISNTPVLNTSDFESVFGGVNHNDIKLDKQGLIREMEFIAFPGTVFEIIDVVPEEGYKMLKVITNDYRYNGDFYVDSRFVNVSDVKPDERKRSMPGKDEVISKMKSLEGYGYMWGGNYAQGIDKLLEFYPPGTELQSQVKDLWCLKGVDCSGLIYQSTDGVTPRNTSSLTSYGNGIEVSGMSASEIAGILLPLDLIVWSGHVIIVLDSGNVIESTPEYGVHKSDLHQRLESIMRERKPVNDWASTSGKRFVVRRFINESY